MTPYRDPRIEVDERGILLKWYYFPFGTKRLSWEQIAQVQERELKTSLLNGRFRIWGTGDFIHWMPLDIKRPMKQRKFIFTLKDALTRPTITPDDPQAFKAALSSYGVELPGEGG